MGRTHAASGALAGVVTAPAASALTGTDLSQPIPLAVYALACAGAALLPDADHVNGTIAWMIPPVTKPACAGVSAVFGGHRNGTHSLLGVVIFTLVSWVLTQTGLAAASGGGAGFASRIPALAGLFASTGDVGVWAGRVLLAGQAGFLTAAATAVLRLSGGVSKPRWSAFCIFVATVLITAFSAVSFAYAPAIPVAVAVGCLAHIFLGDILTKEGCPLLWPFNRRWRFKIANITTNTPIENWVITPLMAICALAAYVWAATGGLSNIGV